MEEKTARRIVNKYLEKRRVRFKMHKEREAGPDFLIDGVALEVKGSDLDEKDALTQLTRYASEYAGLVFAIPVDRLNLTLLYGLYYLEAATKHLDLLNPRLIKILLLHEAEGNEHGYFAKEYESTEALLKEIQTKLATRARLPYDTKPEQVVSMVAHQVLDVVAIIQIMIAEELVSFQDVYEVHLD